jgi:ribosomal protein S18 acetylase RimI-like enzyme
MSDPPSADVSIRDAASVDAGAVRALWRNFREEAPEPVWRAGSDDDHLRALTEAIGTDVVLLAEVEGAPAGLAVAEMRGEDAGYLHILYVPAAFRRRGVAAALLRQVALRLTVRGAEFLELDVLADNGVARGVYERWGFSLLELTLVARVERLTDRL